MPGRRRRSEIGGMDSFDTWTLIAAPILGVAMVVVTVIATLINS